MLDLIPKGKLLSSHLPPSCWKIYFSIERQPCWVPLQRPAITHTFYVGKGPFRFIWPPANLLGKGTLLWTFQKVQSWHFCINYSEPWAIVITLCSPQGVPITLESLRCPTLPEAQCHLTSLVVFSSRGAHLWILPVLASEKQFIRFVLVFF